MLLLLEGKARLAGVWKVRGGVDNVHFAEEVGQCFAVRREVFRPVRPLLGSQARPERLLAGSAILQQNDSNNYASPCLPGENCIMVHFTPPLPACAQTPGTRPTRPSGPWRRR